MTQSFDTNAELFFFYFMVESGFSRLTNIAIGSINKFKFDFNKLFTNQ